MTRVLVIDNYDSFVYTLNGYLLQLGAETEVLRNDDFTADEAAAASPSTTPCCSRRDPALPRRPG